MYWASEWMIQEQTDAKVDKAFEQMRETLMRELKDELPPEFLNRIDDIIIFRGLDVEDVRKITKILVDELNHSLKEKGHPGGRHSIRSQTYCRSGL
jgi:ATP-dependent Clp protease ATP-binding subunit ClpA